MPFLALIVSPAISDELKAAMETEAPAMFAALKSAPGVKNVFAGPLVAEKGGPATSTKMVQLIEFESAEAAEGLKTNPPAAIAALKSKLSLPEPEISNLFELETVPSAADLQAVTSIAVLSLHDVSKGEEAKAHMKGLMGEHPEKKVFGGKSLKTEGQGVVIASFSGKEEAMAADQSPEAAAGKAAWEKFGTAENVWATLQAA